MREFVAILVLILFNVNVNAQSFELRGLVKNAEKKPIENALIKVYYKDSFIDSTYSDQDGSYRFRSIRAVPKIKMVVSAESYKVTTTKELRLYADVPNFHDIILIKEQVGK